MRIGVPTEVKPDERRVALTPVGAHELSVAGHEVLVQSGAGRGSGIEDEMFSGAGARIVGTAEEVWARSELVLKVKEPVTAEYGFLREDLTLFAYLHLAADPALTRALVGSGATAIGYETVEGPDGGLPLLAPMSEIAGRLATQVGAFHLQAPQGGNGTLIGGAPGVAPAGVLVLGGGAVGAQAARVAAGMGAQVTILERSPTRIRELEERFFGLARVLMSDALTLTEELARADLVIGAVLIPGALAPRLIGRQDLAALRPGAVVVDVAIDQGGCVETARPTTHADPTYVVDGVVHYCVTNMPGAVPRTSTRALTNATLPWVLRLAADGGLGTGVNVERGRIVNAAVEQALAAQPAMERI
jgi:alanine dehydrogenase